MLNMRNGIRPCRANPTRATLYAWIWPPGIRSSHVVTIQQAKEEKLLGKSNPLSKNNRHDDYDEKMREIERRMQKIDLDLSKQSLPLSRAPKFSRPFKSTRSKSNKTSYDPSYPRPRTPQAPPRYLQTRPRRYYPSPSPRHGTRFSPRFSPRLRFKSLGSQGSPDVSVYWGKSPSGSPRRTISIDEEDDDDDLDDDDDSDSLSPPY